MTDRILIIGAGVAALCLARHLQLAGRKVALIDPQPVTGGASFGNGGFISPASFMPGAQPGMVRKLPTWLRDPLGPLAIRPMAALKDTPWFLRWLKAGRPNEMERLARVMHGLHRTAFDEWRFLVGPQIFGDLIRREGEMLLWDSGDPGATEATEKALEREFGEESQVLDRAALEKYYPGLSPVVRRGLVKTGNGHTVSPARLCLALADLLRRDGADFIAEKAVKIVPQGGGIHMVLTNCGNHPARDLVVAAGVWSRDLLQPLGIRIPLTSQRGYHVMLPAGAADIGMPFIHRGRGIGMTPMAEGLRIAGTVEFGGIDGLPDERRADQALAHARQLFPQMHGDPVTIWTGQRPATPDSLPVLGTPRGHPGLWLCFGSGAYGMTQAPPAGRLAADLILRRKPLLDPADFAPARFGA